MKTDKPNPDIVSAAIFDVVDNQLRENQPPETRQTLERLMAEGISQAVARQLIAAVVSTEIFEVLNQGRSYNRALCGRIATPPKVALGVRVGHYLGSGMTPNFWLNIGIRLI